MTFYKRYQRRVLLLLFFAITINILDRQVLSLAAPVLRDQLHLSDTQYGVIVFGFLLGMAVGQVPIGALLDRVGARRGLAFIASWWSLANAAHAFMRTMGQFTAISVPAGNRGMRELFGGSEGDRAVVSAEGPGAGGGIL